jgi:uncharacterized membrane protein
MAGNYKLTRYEKLLGFLVGVLTPVFGITVMYDIYPELQRIDAIENDALKIIITRVSTFGLILNAILFFTAIQLNRDKAASGILSACIIFVFLLIVYKFVM